MRRCCRPCSRRASNCGRRNGHVLRGREALGRSVSREVRARAVSGVALFICGEVTQVILHRRNVCLLLRVRELRNRNRGKNTDDDDNDEKLDQRKALLLALYHCKMLLREWWALGGTQRLTAPVKAPAGPLAVP